MPVPIPTLFTQCTRNLLRQRGRTSAVVSAIGLGVVALIIAGGFIGWILSEMRDLTISTWYGHVQVAKAGYWAHGTADPERYRIPEAPPELRSILKSGNVLAAAPRLAFAGLASHDDRTLSFLGEAVDPAAEEKFGRSLLFMKEHGENLRPGEIDTAVIGLGLAANLGVKPGDKLVLLTNLPRGGVNAIEVTVRGVFHTANQAFDDSTIRIPLAAAARLLRSSAVHSWKLLIADPDRAVEVASRMQTQLAASGLEAQPWTALAEAYVRTEALFERQLGAVALVLGIMIVLGISNSMIINVLERVGEIGTSMALGASRRQILKQFVIEGGLLGVGGATAGVVIGVVLAGILSWFGIPLPPPPGLDTPIVAEIRVSLALAAGSFALAVGCAILASIYPAMKASRMVIVDALRQVRV